jgi:hypothetical protein
MRPGGVALTLTDGSGHMVRSVSDPGIELGWATALSTLASYIAGLTG